MTSAEAKTDVLIVKGKIKDYIKSKECNTASDLYEGLSNVVMTRILDKAIERAKANGRKTVQEKDL